MKILNLYFKNINSLEGESRIDFSQNPLANAGVFAIVGPNGSGKSSILDAISLALYGETFRFDRPAEQVMTTHSRESFAQVDFALADEKFRTRWQVNREENQSVTEIIPQMQLIALTADGETVLADGVSDVCRKMTDMIGMDFRNFSRSILLAQGDFAAFLHALDSERMDILEKMSGTDIYEQQKQQLVQVVQQAETAVAQTQQDIAVLPLMDAATWEASEQDLADFSEQVIEFKQQKHELHEQLAWAQTVKALEEQAASLAKNHRHTEQQLAQKQADLERCAAVQSAAAFQNDVQAITALQQQLAQNHASRHTLTQGLHQLQQQLSAAGLTTANAPSHSVAEQKQIVDELKHQLSQSKMEFSAQSNLHLALTKQLNEKQALQNNTLRWLETHTADKTLLDHFPDTGQLIALRAELVELNAEQELANRRFRVSDTTLKKNTAALDAAKKALADFQEQLLYAEKDADDTLEHHTLTDLEILHVEQQQRVLDFNELYALARVNEKLGTGGFWRFLTARHTDNTADLVDLKRQAADLTEQIAQAKNIRTVLEQAVLNEVLIQRLRHERPHLVDGKPCPLCGALQHPYASVPPKPADSRQALTNQKIHLQDLLSRADTLTKQIASIEKQAQQAVDKDSQLQRIRAEFVTLGNKLNVGQREFGLHNVAGLKNLLKEEQAELSRIKSLLKRYAQQQDKVTRIRLHLEKEQANLAQLEQVHAQLNSEAYHFPHELLEIETNLSRCQAAEKRVAAEVDEQLRHLGEALPDKDKETAFFDRLEARKRDYQTHVLREKALADELLPLVEKVAANQARIDQLQSKINSLSEKLQTEEAVSLQLAVLEKQTLLTQQTQLHATLQQQMQDFQQLMNEKLVGTPFAHLKDLQNALALLATESHLKQQHAALEKQLEKIAADSEKNQARLAAEQALNLTDASVAHLETEQRRITEKLAIASEEVRTLTEKRRRQAGLQEKVAALTAQLKQQQQHLTQAQAHLDGSQTNGMAFRRQVQQAMIHRLLGQTNKMLEKISGRYYLRQLPTAQGLALEIEDTQQQNSRRSPHSLSGGESFVISLALALGLSELANNGKAVDSLFLDEGFGNLDPEALNTVVNTLQSLRHHGKTVGVISHVEAVKKRIKTRIELVKKPNGLSQLKKVS